MKVGYVYKVVGRKKEYEREWQRKRSEKRRRLREQFLMQKLLDKNENLNYEVLAIPPDLTQFKGADESEPTVCKTFGCRKHLDLNELRMGSICFNCSQKTNVIQPTKFIQH